MGRFKFRALFDRFRAAPLPLLGFLFVVSFLVPVLLALHFTGLIQVGNRVLGTRPVNQALAEISAQGQYLRIVDSTQLNPENDRDYILMSWFRLNRLPRERQRLIILSKYTGISSAARGFALALDGEDRGQRPAVFWGDGRGRARWFEFPEVNLIPGQWFGLIITLRQGRYLGLHLLQVMGRSDAQISLLGGFDLGASAGAEMEQADIIVGAVGRRQFRGEVGPIGIASLKDVDPDLKDDMKQLAKSAAAFPDLFKRRELKLWVSESEKGDQSKFKHEIKLEDGASTGGAQKEDREDLEENLSTEEAASSSLASSIQVPTPTSIAGKPADSAKAKGVSAAAKTPSKQTAKPKSKPKKPSAPAQKPRKPQTPKAGAKK